MSISPQATTPLLLPPPWLAQQNHRMCASLKHLPESPHPLLRDKGWSAQWNNRRGRHSCPKTCRVASSSAGSSQPTEHSQDSAWSHTACMGNHTWDAPECRQTPHSLDLNCHSQFILYLHGSEASFTPNISYLVTECVHLILGKFLLLKIQFHFS